MLWQASVIKSVIIKLWSFSLFQLSLYARRQYRLASLRIIIIIIWYLYAIAPLIRTTTRRVDASVRGRLRPIEISYKSEIAWAGFTVFFVVDMLRSHLLGSHGGPVNGVCRSLNDIIAHKIHRKHLVLGFVRWFALQLHFWLMRKPWRADGACVYCDAHAFCIEFHSAAIERWDTEEEQEREREAAKKGIQKIEMRTCNKRLKMMENVTFSIVITFDCVIYVLCVWALSEWQWKQQHSLLSLVSIFT